MKQFAPHPGGNVEGILWDSEAPTRKAIFLTPGQAKFMACFMGIREAQLFVASSDSEPPHCAGGAAKPA